LKNSVGRWLLLMENEAGWFNDRKKEDLLEKSRRLERRLDEDSLDEINFNPTTIISAVAALAVVGFLVFRDRRVDVWKIP
jgi:hypothetical protein